MTFKLSLEINNDQITSSTKRSFMKAHYIVCKNKKKNINFEQNARLHLDCPKYAICETASNAVFVPNFSFTTKNNYFRVAVDEACEAFNKVLIEFGYTQKIEGLWPQMSSSICFATTSAVLISQNFFTDLHPNIEISLSPRHECYLVKIFTTLPPRQTTSFHHCVAAISTLHRLVSDTRVFTSSTSTGSCNTHSNWSMPHPRRWLNFNWFLTTPHLQIVFTFDCQLVPVDQCRWMNDSNYQTWLY